MRVTNRTASYSKFITRQIAKRKIGDIWATNIERHTILRESQLRIDEYRVFVGAEKILGWSAWVQNGKLSTAYTIFYLGLGVLEDGFTKGLFADFSKFTIYGTAQRNSAFPRQLGT